MSTKTIAVVNQSAPFAHASAKESLDVALILGSYEQPTSLFFHGDGVWQLIDNAAPAVISIKNFLKTFHALEFYDIENIFVCETSLKERKLNKIAPIENIQIVSSEQFSETLKNHNIILNF